MSVPGAIATILVGVYSTIYALIFFKELLFLGVLDLVLWGVLGAGIYKNSRVAVINTFIMYILGGALFRLTPLWHNNIFAIIYVILLLFALRGTFAYNKLLKEMDKTETDKK